MSRNGRRKSVVGWKEDEIGGGRRIEWRRESEEGDFCFEVLDLTFEFFLGFVGFVVAFLAGTGVVGIVVFFAGKTPHGDIIIVVVVVIALVVGWAPARWHCGCD